MERSGIRESQPMRRNSLHDRQEPKCRGRDIEALLAALVRLAYEYRKSGLVTPAEPALRAAHLRSAATQKGADQRLALVLNVRVAVHERVREAR